MRGALFRIVSGILFGLICSVTVDALVNGLDFAPSLEDWMVMVAGLAIAPTFGVYAVLGERAAYRVLLPGMALIQLPQIVLDAVVKRTVELPEYLRDPPTEGLDRDD